MQDYNYKTLNYNDYTTTRSSSISSSSSTTKEETEKRLLTPDTQKLIREIRQMYHDAIGSYPAVYVCRAIIKTSRARFTAWKSWNTPCRKPHSLRVRRGRMRRQSCAGCKRVTSCRSKPPKQYRGACRPAKKHRDARSSPRRAPHCPFHFHGSPLPPLHVSRHAVTKQPRRALSRSGAVSGCPA